MKVQIKVEIDLDHYYFYMNNLGHYSEFCFGTDLNFFDYAVRPHEEVFFQRMISRFYPKQIKQ